MEDGGIRIYKRSGAQTAQLRRLIMDWGFMTNIYAMRRANGDWFAFDDHGRFLVPIFHTSGDAMIARARNTDMLLFKPVALDAHLLKQLVPVSGGDVDFRLVKDPIANLNQGSLVELAHIASLVAT